MPVATVKSEQPQLSDKKKQSTKRKTDCSSDHNLDQATPSASSSHQHKQRKGKQQLHHRHQHQPIGAGSFRTIQPPISKGILEYLDSKNFKTPTPVQEATIPLFLKNKDVAVQAVTGSGKTLSFLIPTVERILQRRMASSPLSKHQIGALILSPTRELALQTWTVCSELCNATQISPPLLLVGGGNSGNKSSSGVNHRPVTEDLKKFHREANDIIIGTPGRMEDVLTRYNVLDVSELDILILDEADVLLFGRTIMNPTIASILNRLPKMRRTGIFSATTTFTNNKSIKPLLQRAGMRNPVLVNVQVAVAAEASYSVDTDSNEFAPTRKSSATNSRSSTTTRYTPTTLTNYYLVTKPEEKICRLVAFLQSHSHEKVIVFFLTCACVDFYGSALKCILEKTQSNKPPHRGDNVNDGDDDGLTIELLHGKLVQKRREKAMERFRSKTCGALFATDVAARGLDVTDTDWVVQVDAPQDPSQFVHRVGRSARAGRQGSSVLFLTEKEESYVDLLANRQVPLQELPKTEVCRRDIEHESSDNDSSPANIKCHKDTEHACSDDYSSAHILKNDEEGSTKDKESTSYIANFLPKIRGLVLKDRDFLEKGTKAFTSYIRAYKEHICGFIFRFASLDLGHLATYFCLLRLPKMPELRDCKGKLKNFIPAGPEVDIYAIPFLDKAREAARQKRLAAELATGGKNAKQIKAEQRKADQLRRQKERRQAAIEKGRNPDKKRGRNAQIVDEWEELAKEERLYKKLRKKKITKEEYEEQLYGSIKSSNNTSNNTRDKKSIII